MGRSTKIIHEYRINMSIVLKATKFAQDAHRGQVDDDGKDYHTAHLEQVALLVSKVTSDEEVIAAAYLHDTLEDTKTTYGQLKQVFGERIADIVHELTHEGKKDSYGYYFPRLRSKEAIIIKFADRLSNLSRMSSWDEKRQRQYLNNSKFWKSGESDKERLVGSLRFLSPEERFNIFCNFCTDCGSENPNCNCWNDE